jgi:hypothetical protein
LYVVSEARRLEPQGAQRYAPTVGQVQGSCWKARWVKGRGLEESMDEEDEDDWLLVERQLRDELAEERGGVSLVSFSG